jgi:N-acetylglucosaminyldiphosphoundecaprenol N-acetyl-beta-D-mannosaminyltransferase
MNAALRNSVPSDRTLPPHGFLEAIRLLGTPVTCATYGSALERIKELAEEVRPTAVCPCNTHILAEARHNPDFAKVLARFDLVLPDGMPVVWALNAGGAGLKDRVYGPYFMRHSVQNAPRPWRHFFFGDSQECLAELRQVLGRLQPDIEIVGMLSPPFRRFTEADEMLFADTINQANPDFVWVALPGVRMERWIIENQWRYRRGVFLAVGDAFSLLSGRRSFAPPWMQRTGLTWAYRLWKEPLRLGPRYLRYNSMFVSYLLWDRLRRRAWQRSEAQAQTYGSTEECAFGPKAGDTVGDASGRRKVATAAAVPLPSSSIGS